MAHTCSKPSSSLEIPKEGKKGEKKKRERKGSKKAFNSKQGKE